MSKVSSAPSVVSLTGIVGSIALLGSPNAAQASPSAPNGLAAGSGYRLVFVTTNTVTGTSSDIATYNALASSAAAAAGLSGTYKAIASTATVNAIDNIACTPSCAADPIFLVTGTEVATSIADLFDGTILTPISTHADGSTVGFNFNNTYTWTGSTFTGQGSGGRAGGTLGTAQPTEGFDQSNQSDWIVSGAGASSQQLPVYAISNELIAGGSSTPVPEPVSLSLLLVGVAGVPPRDIRPARKPEQNRRPACQRPPTHA